MTSDDKKYPCEKCGKLRTKDEGGAVFTVCDDCWDIDEKAKIKHVYVFENGMCAVFDYKGQQVSELQGEWKEVFRKVLDACDENTIIRMQHEWR